MSGTAAPAPTPAQTAQLAIWNVALAHLGERRIASLTEPREPARVLADEWDAAVRGCLEMAPWSFATRTQQVGAGGAGAGPFANAFAKPTDWLRTADIAADFGLTVPLDGYLEEGGYWYAEPGVIFVRYVSTDPGYGYGIARWPQQFADLVALALAARAARRLTDAGDILGEVVKLREAAARDALAFEEQTAARQYSAPSGAGETRLQVYNDALAHLGRARTPSLTQATETVRALHDQYRTAVRWCLERAPWSFAAVTVALPSAARATFQDGYPFEVAKPADHILTVNIASEGSLQVGVEHYVEEGRFWFSDNDGLVVRYVSATPGFDPTGWPPHFCDLLALRLAELCAGRLAAEPKEVAPALAKMRAEAETLSRSVEAESVARVYPAGTALLPRVQIYNDALAHLDLRRIGSTSEVSDTVRELNDQFAAAARWCLMQAPWNFAGRSAQVPALTGATAPPNAYPFTFAKPADWLMTLDVAADAQFQTPVEDFVDETGGWYADVAPLNVRYVSADPAFGLNAEIWPPTFRDLVALRLAEMSAGRLGASALAPALAQKREAARAAAIETELARAFRSFPIGTDAQTRLRVYNAAMAHLGRPRLSALTEAHPLMRLLHDAWNLATRWSLEQGPWTFAIRAIMIGPFAAAGPTFGYRSSFKKPDDWLQTVEVSEFEDFRAGATRYADETGWWFSDAPGLFIRYVSLGPNYGFDLDRWSPTFADLVAARMAELVAPQIGAPAEAIEAKRERVMKRLRATDALNTPPAFPPEGSWTAARRGAWRGGRRFGDGPGAPGVPLTGDSTLSGDSDLPIGSDFVPRISG